MRSIKAWTLFFLAFFLSGLMQLSHGQEQGPAAAPPMSNDGKAVDQGVAYVLMLLALLLTYLIH
ncbi:Arabinogalactan peptide 16 [Platanthera guangdongensis]|uniref:Arabinogalactan peptide 16 n=1 Tax=Platanthera guangdongensis TaxID=2320717 RepID=A0ABR2M2H9_9ASPA